jgi:CheY-like chemotaxis protein
MAKRILVVDDEESLVFFLGETLARLGPEYCVKTARSAEQALRTLSCEPVDLIVTDLRMPGKDGLELIRQARLISPCTRTILITAYGDEDVQKEARRLGAYRYITKPFTAAEFTQIVQEALQREMLLAQMFHELRMPLTYIMSYAEMLADESEGAHHEWARAIQCHTHRMREALDDFTLLTEWNASQMPGYLQSVNLLQTLETAVSLLSPSATSRNQTLQVEPLSEPITINTDVWLLGALLAALISDAIKRTPEEGHIYVGAKQNGKEEITLTVKGNGNGGGAQTKPPMSGKISAGLAVAQRLASALSGDLQVEPNGQGGAISRLILPRALHSEGELCRETRL